ncbi:hypothetical protein EYF80_062388 [Liparis tanakae]|uniref:Uncharacterized protein n=1 Tax=Liparis tanakae TaxID=230148 RepID=A0A4Z2EFE6_9TELE|nr:hypothetical protein EYF80_062388 [Liparis tanakae]
MSSFKEGGFTGRPARPAPPPPPHSAVMDGEEEEEEEGGGGVRTSGALKTDRRPPCSEESLVFVQSDGATDTTSR